MQRAEPDVTRIFADDASTRLQNLSEQLLELERSPGKAELLAELVRETHSLKGAAGMVGLASFARVVHALEEPLQQLRSGKLRTTANLTDKLLSAVDGLRSLVEMAAAGGEDERQAALAAGIIQRLADGGGLAEVAEPMPRSEAPAVNGNGSSGNHHASSTSTMQVAVQRLDQIDRLTGEAAAAHLRLGQLLADELGTDPSTVPQYRELDRLLNRLQEETMRARMVSLSTITPQLHRAVRDVANAGGKNVRWEVLGGDTEIDRKVLEKLTDPLVHLVRNAVDHGIETPAKRQAAGKPAQAFVRIQAVQHGSEIIVTVSDDGAGIDFDGVRSAAVRAGIDASQMSDADAMKLVFKGGVSTAPTVTEVSGRGAGLDVVRQNLDLVHGRVDVHTVKGQGAEFRIAVPITLTIVRCLIVESAGQRFAVPALSVVKLLPKDTPEEMVAGRALVRNGPLVIPVSSLAGTLRIGSFDSGPVVILSVGPAHHAFRVDHLVGERDLVIKGLGQLLPRIEAVAGAAIEPDGAVIVELDVPGLLDLIGHDLPTVAAVDDRSTHQPSILVVDDALTIRELQRSILERAGYAVRVATNGEDALRLLHRQPSDLVLTDVEMPSMDGFSLTEAIRRHPKLGRTPIVILTSHDSEADRQRGLDAGADAYIIKKGFDQQRLLSLVEQLLLGGAA